MATQGRDRSAPGPPVTARACQYRTRFHDPNPGPGAASDCPGRGPGAGSCGLPPRSDRRAPPRRNSEDRGARRAAFLSVHPGVRRVPAK
eukprot:768470-Hanusia_phi.AAC.3